MQGIIRTYDHFNNSMDDLKQYKMNEIASRRFVYVCNTFKTVSACVPFTKNKERIQKFKIWGPEINHTVYG